MTYTYLLQTYSWITAVVRFFNPQQASITSPDRRKWYGALALLLVLGSGLMATSPVLHAQEASAAVATTVNINTADAPALATALKGVGQSRAQEIVRYREAYGPFASAEELMEVKGIGQSTLDKNRKVITLE